MKAYYKPSIIGKRDTETERRFQTFRTDIRFILKTIPKLIAENEKLYLIFPLLSAEDF